MCTIVNQIICSTMTLFISIKQSWEKNLSTETTLANLIDSLQFNLDCDRVNGIVTGEYKNILYGRLFDSPF